MKVAKLSTDKIVRYLKSPRQVSFARGEWVMVTNYLGKFPSKVEPYWVPACQVVWVLEFQE